MPARWRGICTSGTGIASGYYVHGLSASHIDIVFTQSPAGYLWSFPRPNHLAVGVGAQADEATSAQLFEMAAAWIDQRVAMAGALTRYSSAIPSCLKPTSSRRPRLPTVGCSSATPPVSSNPITREGLYYALASAQLAATSLLQDHASRRYLEGLRGEIHHELRKAARMKDGFFR